ncbi:MAG: Txe/YoeB family addiction module toxin [Parabacteroides sp.]|nr:Txe/YoeB family addiction module toxin [Parabacteroides sp.]
MYEVIPTKQVLEDVESFRRAGDKASLRKIYALVEELYVHPYTGTGKPEQLRGNWSGYWSRRINKKDRLIYKVEEDRVIVTVVQAKEHYNDR